MNTYKERAQAIAAEAAKLNKPVYNDADHQKDPTERQMLQGKSPKLATLEEAIRRSGLKDGMTISFHHHFRGTPRVSAALSDTPSLTRNTLTTW